MDRRRWIQNLSLASLTGLLINSSKNLKAQTPPTNPKPASPLLAAPQWILLGDGTPALWIWLATGSKFAKLSSTNSDDDGPEIFATSMVELPSTQAGSVTFPLLPRFASANDQFFTFNVETATGITETFKLKVPLLLASDGAVRFLAGSCINQNHATRTLTLKAMMESQGDFTILLGDAIYYENENWRNLDSLRSRWQLNRSLAEFGALAQSKPIAAVWDDHDFGPNDSGTNFRFRHQTRKIFLEQFPREVSGAAQEQEGIYFSQKQGNTRFIILDNRTYRDPVLAFSAKNYLGPQQLDWFKKCVSLNDYSRLIIAGGSQFFVYNPLKEGYRQYAEHQEFQQFLKENLKKPCLFISGDIHQTEILDLRAIFPVPAWELTTSGIANTPVNFAHVLRNSPPAIYRSKLPYTFARVGSSEDAFEIDHIDYEGRTLANLLLYDRY